MQFEQFAQRDRITVAILALGGQGGGVLADWIIEVASKNGFVAQGTSVPGVAQRTGSTVYYIEMIRKSSVGANQPDPVLAMMPVPGDVDIVIASELMEAGRAILRGFVTDDRTTLIGSTHRVYTITEKSVPGDGMAASQRIIDAAERRAKHFISFDMEEAANEARSMISSVMFGALAGSGALPFERSMFEDAIKHGGKAVPANLKGFGAGYREAGSIRSVAIKAALPPEPTTAAGQALKARIEAKLPSALHPIALEAARKLMDYQDAAYANLYFDRLEKVLATDDGAGDYQLSREAGRYLALWMAYEDTIRVADLKIRETRSARVRREVQLGDQQLMTVTEYMHPRLQEVCETMPKAIGRAILSRPGLVRRLQPLFASGRHVRTTSVRWFLALRMLAAMRGIRRSTLRYADEQARIENWLGLLGNLAKADPQLASEVATLPRLLKGYGDTFERGLMRFERIIEALPALRASGDAASRVAALRDAALADEGREHFDQAMQTAKAA